MSNKIECSPLDTKSPLLDKVKEAIKHQFLDQQHLKENATAEDFFNEISYKVKLTELYKVVDTCYYDDAMPFVPVLVEIMAEEISKCYSEKKYLLQVWSKESKKVFELPLQEPVKIWSICYDHLLYILEGVHLDKEKESKDVYITHLTGKNPTTRVTKFIHESFGETKILFAANDKEIQCLNIGENKFNGDETINAGKLRQLCMEENPRNEEGDTFAASSIKVQSITPKLKIIALLSVKRKTDLNAEEGEAEENDQGKGSDQDQEEEEKCLLQEIDDKSTEGDKEQKKETKNTGVNLAKQIIVVFETNDHLLDFNYLVLTREEKESYLFLQIREMVSREETPHYFNDYQESKTDRIVKTIFTRASGILYSVAVRNSGLFDIYTEMRRTWSSRGFNVDQVKDVAMSFQAFYFTRKDNKEIFVLKHESSTNNIEFSSAEKLVNQYIDFDQIFVKKVHRHGKHNSISNPLSLVRIFSALMINYSLSYNTAFAIVGHANIISRYNLLESKWDTHLVLKKEDQILHFFNIKDGNDDLLKLGICSNGQIYNLISAEHSLQTVKLDFKGEIIRVIKRDPIGTAIYALVKRGDEYHIVYYKYEQEHVYRIRDQEKKKLYKSLSLSNGEEIEDDSEEEGDEIVKSQEDLPQITNLNKIDENTNVVLIQNNLDKKQYVLVQQDTQSITIYQEKEMEGLIHWKKVKEIQTVSEIEGTIHSAICQQDDAVSDSDSSSSDGDSSEEVKEHEESDEEDKEQLDDDETSDSDSDSESANSTDDDDDSSAVTVITLFDDKNIYKIDFDIDDCTVFENHNVASATILQDSSLYALCRYSQTHKLPSGLRLYYQKNLGKEGKQHVKVLKEVDVGAQGYCQYNPFLERLAYINSLNSLMIIPKLHTNLINFMGFGYESEYLIYKIIGDKFITLRQQNSTLYTYDLTTGKMIHLVRLKEDYKGYNTASFYQKDKVLIYSEEKVKGAEKHKFFDESRFSKCVDNQRVFIERQNTSIRTWKLIEIEDEQNVKVHYEFKHPAHNKKDNWMYINSNNNYMVSILPFQRFFLYTTDGKDTRSVKTDVKLIKWQLKRKITDFPSSIGYSRSFLPFLSPDFSLSLNVDKREQTFIIRDFINCEDIKTVPKDIISFGNQSELKKVAQRFRFIDNNTFCILSETNVEKIINFRENFKEEAFNQVPLFTKKTNQRGCYHYFEKVIPTTISLKRRLILKYQDFKTSHFLHQKKGDVAFYDNMFSVHDFCFGYLNLSFTYIHWSYMDQIVAGKIQIDELDKDKLNELIYNVFPGGQTILHKIATDNKQLSALFKRAHPNEKIKYHLPILPNFQGDTALKICVDNSEYKSIDMMFRYLRFYDIDHHSRAIKSIYSVFLAKKLPQFLEYLDSRMIQNTQMKQITKASIKKKGTGIMVTSPWMKDQDFNKNFCDPKKKSVNRINCELVDIAGVYHFRDEHFENFFKELAMTDLFDIFNKRPIQKIIEVNYPYVRNISLYLLFFPFCIFLVVYLVFTYEVHPKRLWSQTRTDIDNAFLILLLVFSTYFLANEFKQIYLGFRKYFESFWNYIDLLPLVGIVAIVAISYFSRQDQNDDLENTVQAIVSFLMWFKLLYFLRFFHSTGYLVRSIFHVIYDMRFFFLVLLITVVAFSDSFLKISLSNEEDDQFVKSFADALKYTYLLVLGEFNVDELGKVNTPVVWILIVFCTLFSIVVLLNLLIAIISDSFASITDNATQAKFQEMASLIYENYYLVSQQTQENYIEKNKFLMTVSDLENDEREPGNIVIQHLKELKEQIEESIENHDQKIQEVSSNQHESTEEIKKINEAFHQLAGGAKRFLKMYRRRAHRESILIKKASTKAAGNQ